MKSFIEEEMRTSCEVLDAVANDRQLLEVLEEATHACIAALRCGNRILFAGNGGSAADAQHFAAELVSRFYYDRPALPAEALTTDTSILTAIGNDYGYERLFARQVEAKGRPGDVFVGITTSGASPNILRGLESARARQMTCIGLTGSRGRALSELCDYLLVVPSANTPKIQEAHGVLGHILCAAIERALCPKES